MVFVAGPLCSTPGRSKAWLFCWSCFFFPVGRTCRRGLALQARVFPSHPNVCFLGSNQCAISSPGLCTTFTVWFSHKNISKPFVNFLAFGGQFLQWLAEFQELFHFGVSISKMPINLSLPLQYYVWVKMTFYYSSSVIVFPIGLIIPIPTQNSYWCHPQIKFLLKVILNPESCYVFLFFPIIAFSGQSKTGCLCVVILPVSIISYPWKAWIMIHRLKFFISWGVGCGLHVCRGVHVQNRGQPVGFSSLLTLAGERAHISQLGKHVFYPLHGSPI